MYGALDISTSGLIAQRDRLAVIASNIANRNTMLDSDGNVNPYRARRVQFSPGDPRASTAAGRALGVHIAQIEVDESPYTLRLDPSSPFAYQTGPNRGYVPMPNVNPVTEQINALDASRAYEANLAAAEATKAMFAQALRLLA